MYPGIRLVNDIVLFYGASLPYHPGKWRVVELLVGALGLRRYYGGRSFVVQRHGLSWQLRPDCLVQRALYYLSCYEVKETEWLRGRVRPDWVFLDVGANFGYYSLLVSHFSGRTARVYSFEPLPQNYELLNLNRELNGLDRMKTLRLALSDRDGAAEFIAPNEGNLGHGRLLAGEGGRASVRVETTTLDGFARKNRIDKIDFIKVDIEGAEMLFLAGARATLRRLRPTLMIECNPEALAEFGTSAEALLETLHGLGYATHTAERSGLRPFDDASGMESYCNLICLPKP